VRSKTFRTTVQAVAKDVEPVVDDIRFTVHRFTKRPKPSNPKNVVVFPCFSEFGTEVLGTVYCIPILMRRFVGKYSIAVGWQGRAFLYRHLVDEFWEIEPQHMWLRKYCRAFHHDSKNLARVEQELAKQGRVITALDMGGVVTYPALPFCLVQGCGGEVVRQNGGQVCQTCDMTFSDVGLFNRLEDAKQDAVWPPISPEKVGAVAKYLKPNSVGVTARNRTTYGRNLPVEFYDNADPHRSSAWATTPCGSANRPSTHRLPVSRT
jgi:hypothetical protein